MHDQIKKNTLIEKVYKDSRKIQKDNQKLLQTLEKKTNTKKTNQLLFSTQEEHYEN